MNNIEPRYLTQKQAEQYTGMTLMAIDPGTNESAYVICDYGTLKPIDKDKISNTKLLEQLPEMIMLNSVQHERNRAQHW